MQELETFLAMGGYGAFVWPAFGLTALVMIWLLAATLRRLRACERALAEIQAAAPGRRRAGCGPAVSGASGGGAEGPAP